MYKMESETLKMVKKSKSVSKNIMSRGDKEIWLAIANEVAKAAAATTAITSATTITTTTDKNRRFDQKIKVLVVWDDYIFKVPSGKAQKTL